MKVSEWYLNALCIATHTQLFFQVQTNLKLNNAKMAINKTYSVCCLTPCVWVMFVAQMCLFKGNATQIDTPASNSNSCVCK